MIALAFLILLIIVVLNWNKIGQKQPTTHHEQAFKEYHGFLPKPEQVPEYSTSETPSYFAGHTTGNESDREYLKSIGVFGAMKFTADGHHPTMEKYSIQKDGTRILLEVGPTSKAITGKDGHFSHCHIKSLEDMMKIKASYPLIRPPVFTAIGADGKQLRPEFQEAWGVA